MNGCRWNDWEKTPKWHQNDTKMVTVPSMSECMCSFVIPALGAFLSKAWRTSDGILKNGQSTSMTPSSSSTLHGKYLPGPTSDSPAPEGIAPAALTATATRKRSCQNPFWTNLNEFFHADYLNWGCGSLPDSSRLCGQSPFSTFYIVLIRSLSVSVLRHLIRMQDATPDTHRYR